MTAGDLQLGDKKITLNHCYGLFFLVLSLAAVSALVHVTWLHVGKRERDRIACLLMIAQRVSTSLKRWNRFLKNSA